MALLFTFLLFVATAAAARDISSAADLASVRSRGLSKRLGVYDGTKTTIQKHPYMVALLYNGQFDSAATIVSPSWAITAGDAVFGGDPSQFTVVAGSNDGIDGTSYDVVNITVDPNFGQVQFDYDYACVKIKGEFKWNAKTKPIKLPKKAPKDNTMMMVAGWGKTSPQKEGEANGAMLQGKMKWLPKKKCASIFSQYGLTWTDRMACVYNKGKTTLCSGDGDDPFVKNGVFYGMFTAYIIQDYCTKDAQPLVLANIYPRVEWLKEVTGAKYEDE